MPAETSLEQERLLREISEKTDQLSEPAEIDIVEYHLLCTATIDALRLILSIDDSNTNEPYSDY